MTTPVITALTRGSRLALAQTATVVQRLERRFPSNTFEVRTISTTGDALSRKGSVPVQDKGIFVKEIEEALLDGEAAFAVHSLKDMPTELPKGLTIAAIAEREDPHDALISKSGADLNALPAGAVIGTGSTRRAAQLLAARPDLRIEPIRGNLDTRIAKLEGTRKSSVAYDAIVVAVAGCRRLGLEDQITEILPVELMLPAVGQGALAIETRQDDATTRAIVATIDDQAAHRAVEAERACLHALGGGCHVPIGAYAESNGDSLHLTARVCSLDGRKIIETARTGPAVEAAALGAALAADLLEQGAKDLIQA